MIKNKVTRFQGKAWRWAGWVAPLSLVAGVLIWAALVRIFRPPAYMLPGPDLVWARLLSTLGDGSLLRHAAATLLEVILGLLAGVGLATVLGYGVAKSRLVERLLSPYLVASQAIPVVAIAPLLVVLIGPGILSKVLVCALTVFFPVLINTVVGLRAVPDNLRDLMGSLKATRWQMLRFLEVPAALPVFLGGLRIGATLSVIGAVVGELIGADRGLGFLINLGRSQFDTALVFVVSLTLITLSLSLYGVVVLLEKRLLRWREQPAR